MSKNLNKKPFKGLKLTSISLRIWLPFALSFTIFIFAAGFYYPKKQESLFIENYSSKIKELAKTVALGVELTLSSDNFEGLKKTINLASSSSEFEFIAIIETLEDGSEQVFQVNPDSFESKNILIKNNSEYLYEKCQIESDLLKGHVLIAFSKKFIKDKIDKLNYPVYLFLVIVLTISLVVFLLIANTISRPIRRLTKAANELERQNYQINLKESTGNDELSDLNNALFSLKHALVIAKARNDEFNKQLEQEINTRTKDLKITTEKLLNAQIISQIGNYEFDIKTRKWIFSDVIYQILSLDKNSEDIDSWQNLPFSEDYPELMKRFEETIINLTGFQKDFKINFTDASKEEKWISIIAEPIFDQAGDIIIISGSIQDITERKLIENEVNRLSLVAKKTSNCVVITDKNRKMLWVNDSLLKLTGYEMHELIGKSPKMFQSPKTDPETLAIIRHSLDNDIEIKVEILNVTKNDTEYWLDMNIVPITDQKNEITGYIAVETDITNRKLTEEELIRREKMLVAISVTSNILLNSFNILDSVSKTLELMGRAVGVDRTYLFTTDLDPNLGLLASQRFEWNTSFVDSQIDNPEMQNIPIKLYDEFLSILLDKKPFVKKTKDLPPNSNLKPILESQAILSILIIPIFNGEDLWGYVGFDDCSNERNWTEAEISILVTFSTAIENALDRENKTETIKSMALFPELNPNPVIRINLDGLIILENKSALDIQNLIFENKLISKSEFLNQVRILLNFNSNKIQLEVNLNDDKFYTVDCLLIENANQINLYFNDITQLKEKEQQLVLAKVRAEASDKAKEEFIANMSHEIRTPLHAISGLSKILKKSALTNEDSKLVSYIAQSGEHLQSLINNVLDFTKITAGEFKLNDSSFSFSDIVEQLKSILFSLAEEKKLILDFKVSNQIYDLLIGDELRLKQSLLNLLSNSLKFTEKGTIFLTAKPIEDNEKNQLLEIIVADSGIGMSDEFINRIFDKFSQEDSSLGRKYGGTGLGMAITKGLIDLMKGTINVTSQKNIGTSFTIHIPFEKNLQKLIRNEDDIAVKNKLNEIKILIVEDNKINLLVANTLLAFYGIKTFEAKNGKEAIDHPNLNEVDLILMDLQMPEMDGFTATKYLREKLSIKVPIIALTANALKTEIERCFEIGMNDYVLKPYNESQLMDAITKNLNLFAEFNNIEKKEDKNFDELYNLNTLKKLSSGSNEFMSKIITMFLEQIPESVSNLKIAFEEGDYETTKLIAHRIKATYTQFAIIAVEQDIILLNYFDVNSITDLKNCEPAINNLVQETTIVAQELIKELDSYR